MEHVMRKLWAAPGRGPGVGRKQAETACPVLGDIVAVSAWPNPLLQPNFMYGCGGGSFGGGAEMWRNLRPSTAICGSFWHEWPLSAKKNTRMSLVSDEK